MDAAAEGSYLSCDEEDPHAFQHWDVDDINDYILPIKNQHFESSVFELELHDLAPPVVHSTANDNNNPTANGENNNTTLLNERACSQLGKYLYRSESLKRLSLPSMELTGSSVEKLFSPWKTHMESETVVEATLWNGRHKLKHAPGSKIERVDLSENPLIGSVGAIAISSFLCTNRNLKFVNLSNIGMGLLEEEMAVFAPALSGEFRTRMLLPETNNWSPSLVSCNLSGNPLGDEAVGILCETLRSVTTLKELNLCNTNIEEYSCISPLLEHIRPSNPAASVPLRHTLNRLDLSRNRIGDDFIRQTAQALQENNNNHLSVLDISGNAGVTMLGLESLIHLLYNTSSLNGIFESNHFLKSIGPNDSIITNNSNSNNTTRNLLEKLLAMNRLRVGPTNTARQKIMLHIFNPTNPALLSMDILDLDIRLMPYVLSMFGLGKDQVTRTPVGYTNILRREEMMYHLVRNWNIPFLFASPSTERRAQGNEVEKTVMKRRRIFPCLGWGRFK